MAIFHLPTRAPHQSARGQGTIPFSLRVLICSVGPSLPRGQLLAVMRSPQTQRGMQVGSQASALQPRRRGQGGRCWGGGGQAPCQGEQVGPPSSSPASPVAPAGPLPQNPEPQLGCLTPALGQALSFPP